MRTKLSNVRANSIRPLLAATLGIALAFTFSCSKKCGDNKYDPKTQFCHNNSDVADKCDGKEYNTETQFCSGNDIVDKCGDNKYDPKTQFCHNNSDVADKCDGKEYNTETQFCVENEILDKHQIMSELETDAKKWIKNNPSWSKNRYPFKAKQGKYFSFNSVNKSEDEYISIVEWTATSKAVIGDCPANSIWKMVYSENIISDAGNYGVNEVPPACKSITPKAITDFDYSF